MKPHDLATALERATVLVLRDGTILRGREADRRLNVDHARRVTRMHRRTPGPNRWRRRTP